MDSKVFKVLMDSKDFRAHKVLMVDKAFKVQTDSKVYKAH